MRSLLFFLLLAASTLTFAQNTSGKKSNDGNKAPSSLEPYYPKEMRAPKKSKKKPTNGPTYESQEQYQARIEKVVKEKRKAEKEMMKPQYSDPMYFGHKRPPKKRKPGKMKFCKECGLRH